MNNQTNKLSVKLPRAAYFAGDYDSTKNILPNFIDSKDRTKDIKTTNISNVKLDKSTSIPFIYGDKDSYIIFPENSITSNFTICSITKYKSKNPDNNKKIIRSIDNKTNFYHGHYNNKIGVIEYDNYEFSKGFPSNTSLNSWVVSCAKNTNSTNISENVIIDGQYSGLSINNDYINNKNKPISTLTINYNNTNNTAYYSNWALSYLLIWDSHLSDNELKTISVSLNNFIKKGETLSFMNLQNQVIYSAPSQSQYSSQYSNKCDNLSDIQKQMLQFNL